MRIGNQKQTFDSRCWPLARICEPKNPVLVTSVLLACSLLGCRILAAQAPAADRQTQTPPIVLRDLTLIADQRVTGFDGNGVVISDGRLLSWDRILSAKLVKASESDQAQFDQYLSEWGLPLHRLKLRIRRLDWPAAAQAATAILELAQKSTEGTRHEPPPNAQRVSADSDARNRLLLSDSQRYLIERSLFETAIQTGRRETALIHFLEAAALQPRIDANTKLLLGDELFSDELLELHFTTALLPIWFDAVALKKLSQRLSQRLDERADDNRRETVDGVADGQLIYRASVEIEIERFDQAQTLLRRIRTRSPLASWKEVLLGRIAIKQGNLAEAATRLNSDRFASPFPAAVATYYRAMIPALRAAQATAETPETERPRLDPQLDQDCRRATLDLLTVAASYQRVAPDLVAAVIAQAAKLSRLRGREREAEILEDELLRNYSRTYHGGSPPTSAGSMK